MDAAQLGQVQLQIHQELNAVRELVSIQQLQLAVLQQQLVQLAQQRPVASPASFTAKLPEYTGAGRVDLWAWDLDMLFAAKTLPVVSLRLGVHGTEGSGATEFGYLQWRKRMGGVEVVPPAALQASVLQCGSETESA